VLRVEVQSESHDKRSLCLTSWINHKCWSKCKVKVSERARQCNKVLEETERADQCFTVQLTSPPGLVVRFKLLWTVWWWHWWGSSWGWPFPQANLSANLQQGAAVLEWLHQFDLCMILCIKVAFDSFIHEGVLQLWIFKNIYSKINAVLLIFINCFLSLFQALHVWCSKSSTTWSSATLGIQEKNYEGWSTAFQLTFSLCFSLQLMSDDSVFRYNLCLMIQ
jgi:hypothetical protein